MDARQRLNRNKKQATNKRSAKKGKEPAVGNRKKAFAVTKTSGGKVGKGQKRAAPPTKTLTRKISDLRQIIAAPRPAATASKQTISQKKSAIKQRLGLQSKSARERIRNAAASTSRNQTRVTNAAAPARSQVKKRAGGALSTVSSTEQFV